MRDDHSHPNATKGVSAPQLSPGTSLIVVLGLLLCFFLWTQQTRYAPAEISYPEFKALVSSNKVVRVTLFGDRVHGVLDAPMALSADAGPAWDFGTWIPGEGDASLSTLLAEHSVLVVRRPMVSPI